MKKIILFFLFSISGFSLVAQINTDKVLSIGRNALYYEDYILAIQYFNQVIHTKPYLAEPYYFRAVAKFLLDDSKGAEEDCSLCIDRNPFITNAYRLRGDSRLNQNKYDGAIEDYTEASKAMPDDKPVLVNLGLAYIQKKDYVNAEKDLNRLVDVYPTYTQGILTRGQMYLEKGDTVRALADYNKAIDQDKYFAQSYSMRGLLYYNKREYDKSLADYDEAVKLDPEVIGNYINRGLVKYSKKDFRGSMTDYDHVVEIDPSNIMARFNRGLLRSQVGDNNKAIADFTNVLQHEPNNYIARLNRSLLYSKISNYQAALSDLNKVLSKYPDFYQGFYNRGEIKKKQGNLNGAEKDFAYARRQEQNIRTQISQGKKGNEQTRKKSDNAIDKFNLLVVADKEENEKDQYSDKARGRIQDRQVKIKLENRFVLTYYQKVDDLRKKIQFSPLLEAANRRAFLKQKLYLSNDESSLNEDQIQIHFASISDFSKRIGESSNNPDLYFGRGMDYLQVQDFANALLDFEQVTKLDSTATLAFFNLGVIHAKLLELKDNVPGYENNNMASNLSQGDHEADLSIPVSKLVKTENYLAILNYTKAIDLSPDFAYAYYNRGELESRQKDYKTAIIDYNNAIKNNPKFAEAYYNRGLDQLFLGKKESGLDDLRKAGELGMINAYSVVKRMSE